MRILDSFHLKTLNLFKIGEESYAFPHHLEPNFHEWMLPSLCQTRLLYTRQYLLQQKTDLGF